jgi:hypothetical protein
MYGTTIWLNKKKKPKWYTLRDQRLSRNSGENLTLSKAYCFDKKSIENNYYLYIIYIILITIIGMSNKLKKKFYETWLSHRTNTSHDHLLLSAHNVTLHVFNQVE